MSHKELDEIRRLISERRNAMNDAKKRLDKSPNKQTDPNQYLIEEFLSTYAAAFAELYTLVETLLVMNEKTKTALNVLRNTILDIPEVRKDDALYMKFKEILNEVDASY